MIKKYHAIIFTLCRFTNVRPFGAHKIAHELRNNGFDVLVINYMDRFSFEELKAILSSTVCDQTLFVGISNTFLTLPQTGVLPSNQIKSKGDNSFNSNHTFLPDGLDAEQEFSDHIKQINPNCKIVVGGAKTDINWSNRIVDYAIAGYADIAVVNLAKHLKYGTPISNKNYKNIYGVHIIDDAVAEGFDFNNSTMTWGNDDLVLPQEVLPLEISRGCIFSCKFCDYRLNGKQTVDYLKHFDIIHRELLDNYNKYGITRYRLLDDTFNDSEEKIDIMLDIVNQLPFKPIFSGYARLDLLASKPHTISKLVDIGFRGMFFGIETLNQKTGSIIGKGADPDRLVRTIIDMKKQYGDYIALNGSFICGLPGESKESVRRTMQRLLTKEIPVDTVTFYPLIIGKKTVQTWNSEFNLDLTKFGYREVVNDFSKTIRVVNWESNTMSYQEAIEMTKDFNQQWQLVEKKQHPTGSLMHNPMGWFFDYKKELFDRLNLDH